MAAPPIAGDYSVGVIYGKIPGTYQLAYYQELDTHANNTTGPLSWTPFYAGEYVLKLQASIVVTSCNIQPDRTVIYPIGVHVRSALHKGGPCDGTLDGGGQLGESAGPGYYHDHGTDPPSYQDTWGGPEDIIQVIKDVGATWNQTHSSQRMGILDLSTAGGGAMSGHSCHRNGLEVDIRYVRNSGEGPLNLGTDLSSYNKALTVSLLQLYANSGWVDLIYVDPASGITSADVPGVVVDSSGVHIDHFHVRITDPDGPDSNNC